ncbi:hypothetical protein [Deinococcus sp. ME38]|uniref:hypothetical protein n=1 Tax=Deinococcus sp. ME38 TaxID=3400344 RepID=UPI003B59E3EB
MHRPTTTQRSRRSVPTRSTNPGALRSTRTRRRSKAILENLNIELPETRGMKSRSSAPFLLAAQYLPADTDLQLLTLEDGWQVYLAMPQEVDATRTNADRTPSDLGNKKRALRDLAQGHSGHDDLSRTPLSVLSSDWQELQLLVIKGLSERLSETPTMKKASNIRSDLKKIRQALQELLKLPEITRIDPRSRRRARRDHWKKGFRRADWPESLEQEVRQMRVAFTDRNYSGPSYAYFNSRVMREVSFCGLEMRFNRLIDFTLNCEGIESPCLMDFMDLDRIARFREWYFHDRVGGYAAFRQICAALSKTAIYLEAMGQLKSGYDLDSRNHGAPWRVLTSIGMSKLAEGVQEGKQAKLEDLPLVSPADLMALGYRCQVQLPRTNDGRVPSTRQIFNRRFAGMFYTLGVYTPLRGKNWRNMRWDTNLKQEGTCWRVHFSGMELKNGVNNTELRTYSLLLPPEATPLIEWWREQLRVFVGDDFENITPFVFPMQSTIVGDDGDFRWVEMSYKYLLASVDSAARDNIRQGFRPHLIRHCVATHVISSGLMVDIQQAATLLGDSIKTVMDTYFKPDEQNLLNSGYYARLSGYKAGETPTS